MLTKFLNDPTYSRARRQPHHRQRLNDGCRMVWMGKPGQFNSSFFHINFNKSSICWYYVVNKSKFFLKIFNKSKLFHMSLNKSSFIQQILKYAQTVSMFLFNKCKLLLYSYLIKYILNFYFVLSSFLPFKQCFALQYLYAKASFIDNLHLKLFLWEMNGFKFQNI